MSQRLECRDRGSKRFGRMSDNLIGFGDLNRAVLRQYSLTGKDIRIVIRCRHLEFGAARQYLPRQHFATASPAAPRRAAMRYRYFMEFQHRQEVCPWLGVHGPIQREYEQFHELEALFMHCCQLSAGCMMRDAAAGCERLPDILPITKMNARNAAERY